MLSTPEMDDHYRAVMARPPTRGVTLSDAMMHDRAGFTPYAGRKISGWPETVLLRGKDGNSSGRASAAAS